MTSTTNRNQLAWTVALVLAIGNGLLLWDRYKPATPVESSALSDSVIRFRVRLPDAAKIELGRASSVAIAPDGSAIVFRAGAKGGTQLYLQTLATSDSAPIPGTEDAMDPFFSPDGHAVGFFADGKLKRVALDGGVVVTLADAPNPRGSTWGSDNFIYLTPRNNTGVWRVPSGGGKLEAVTAIADGQLSHRWPALVPGGKALLYTIWNDTGWGAASIMWHPLDGQPSRELVRGGSFARIIDLGEGQSRLVYTQGRSLMTAPLDLSTGTTTGPGTVAVEGLRTNNSGAGHFDFSDSGALVYLGDASVTAVSDLVWIDRAGRADRAAGLEPTNHQPQLSPDGSRLAYYRHTGDSLDVWVDHLPTNVSTQLTRQAGTVSANAGLTTSVSLVWSPDGRQLTYAAGATVANLFRVSLDRPGSAAERLTTSEHLQAPASWSPNGRTLAYVDVDPLSGKDIWLLTVADGVAAEPRPFLRTPFNELSPAISPDGRWIAYHSNESGLFEVYVQTFPVGGRRIQISTNGGAYPRWSPDSRSLFFIAEADLENMAVVQLDSSAATVPGSLQSLFGVRPYLWNYSVSPDGNRLLMTEVPSAPGAASEPAVVLNWKTELRAAGTQP